MKSLEAIIRELVDRELDEVSAISTGGAGMQASGQVAGTGGAPLGMDMSAQHRRMWSGDEPENKNKSKKEKKKHRWYKNESKTGGQNQFLLEQTRQKFEIPLPADLEQLADIFQEAGHELYVVGGAVRDALLGKTPKDFDVATDADPERILEILEQYPEFKTYEVGKAFGVVNVVTPNKNEYEIATFREDVGKGRRPDAVEFSTIEQDVKRRDLTVNALFYDINNKEVVDYVGGIEDLQQGRIRSVGDPSERFDEDRLRILRAIRFAARMGSGLGEETENAILQDNSLEGVSVERIRDEFIKSIKSAKSVVSLMQMYSHFDLWKQVLPGLKINSNFKETNNIPVQLALLLQDNNYKDILEELNKLAYPTKEARQIAFLVLFQELDEDTAYQFKKTYDKSGLTDDDLYEFAKLAGQPDKKLVDAFVEFELSVGGQEVMDDGFSGPEIGKEIERRETENFKELL